MPMWRIRITDVAEGVKRRFFGRAFATAREEQRHRAASDGARSGDARMAVTAIVLVTPFVAAILLVLLDLGSAALWAIPVLVLTFWLARRSTAANRRPVRSAWRERRQRRGEPAPRSD
jgi:cobalamin biosynthesis protein CobD/CbiB